jgi:hypothetical protein
MTFEGSRGIIFQQIAYLFEKCKQCITKSIPFAVHNFGPFEQSQKQREPAERYLFRKTFWLRMFSVQCNNGRSYGLTNTKIDELSLF